MVRENWQLRCAELKQRGEYLYKSKLWSDCEFQLNDVTIKAHKLLMAMASPVFAKMLYGGDGEVPMNPVPIFDVRVEVFDLLLQYIYSDNLNIDSTENAFELYNAAKKWRLPYIAKQCMMYLSKDMSPNNVCNIYKVACESNDKQLQKGCEKIFSERTKEVLNDVSFCNADLQIVTQLFSLDLLNIDSEMDLFEAAVKYANIQNKKSQQNALKRIDQSKDWLQEGSGPNDGPSSAKKPRICDQESKLEDHDCVTKMTLDNKKRHTETGDSPGKVSLASHGTASDSTVSKSDSPETLEDCKDGMGKLKYRDLVKNIRFLTLTPQEFADCSTLPLLLTKSEILALSMNISSKETPYLMPEGLSINLVPRTQVTKEAREKSAAVFRSTIQNFSYSKKFESIPFYVRNTAWTLMTLVHNKNEDILVLAVTCFLDSEPREWLQNTKIRIRFCTHKPVPKYLHKISLKFSEPTPEYAAWLAQINRSELLNPAYGFLDDFNTVTYKLYINTAPGLSESPDQETLRDESTASIGELDVSNLVLRVSKSSLPPSKGSTPTLSQPPVQNSERLTQKSSAFSQPLAASQPRSVVSSVPASQQSSLAPTKVLSSRPSPIVTPPVESSRPTPVLTHPVPSLRMSSLPPTMVPPSRPLTAVTPAIPSSQRSSIVNPHVASSRTTSASITSVPSSRPPPIVNPPAPASKQSPSLPTQISSLRPPTSVTGQVLLQTSLTVNRPMLPRPSPPVAPSVPSSQSSTAVTKVPSSVVSSLVCPTITLLTSESRPSPNITALVKSSQLPLAATLVSALRKSIAPTLTRPSLAVTTPLTSSNVTSPILSSRTIVTSPTASLRTTPNKATSVLALRLELLRLRQLVNASLPVSLSRQSAGTTLPLASQILPTSTNIRPQPSLPLQHLSGVPRIAHHHQQPFHLQSMVKSRPFENVPSPSQYLHRSTMLRIPAPLMRPPSTIPVYEPSKLRAQAIVNTPPAPCKSSLASLRPQSPQSLGNTPATGPNPAITPSIYQASRLQSMVNSPTHYFNRLLAPPYRTTLIDATDPCALASPNYIPNRPSAGFSLPQSISNTRPTSAEMTRLSASSQVNTAPLPCVESISSPSMTTLSQSSQSPSDSDDNMCLTPPSSSKQIMTSSEPKFALLTSSQSTADTTIVSSLSGPQINVFSLSDSVSSSTGAASFARAASEELFDDVFEPLSLKKLTLTKVNYIFVYHSEKSQSNDMTVQPISGSMSSSLGSFNTRPLREDNSSSARDSKDGSFNESHDSIIIPRVLPTVTTATASFQPLHAITLPWPTRLKISKPVRSTTSGNNVISRSTSLSGPITSTRISADSVSSDREFSSSSLTKAASKGLFDKSVEPPSLKKIALAELNSKSTPRSIDMAIRSMSGSKTSCLKPFISSEPESALLISSRSTANTTLVASLWGSITSATSTGATSKELFNKIYEPPHLKEIALAQLSFTSKYMPGSNDMATQPMSGPKTSILGPSNLRLLRVDEASFPGADTEQFDEIFEPSSLPSDSDANVSLPFRSSSIQKKSAKQESANLMSSQSTANTLSSSVPGPRTSKFSTSSTVLTRAASEELFDEVFEPPSLKKLTLAKVNYIFICHSNTSLSNVTMVQPISDSMSSSLGSFNTRPLCEDNGSFARDSKNRPFNQSQDTIFKPHALPLVTTASASFQPLHAVTLPWPTRAKISKPVRSSASLLSGATTQLSSSMADTILPTFQSVSTSENLLKEPDHKLLSPENELETEEAGVFQIIKNKPGSQRDQKCYHGEINDFRTK